MPTPTVTIIQVYALISTHEDHEVEEQLKRAIKVASRKDILVLHSDWYATIGGEGHLQWTGKVGKFGLGETSDQGNRLLKFAQTYQLAFVNTLNPLKELSVVARYSPEDLVHHITDPSAKAFQFEQQQEHIQAPTYSATITMP